MTDDPENDAALEIRCRLCGAGKKHPCRTSSEQLFRAGKRRSHRIRITMGIARWKRAHV